MNSGVGTVIITKDKYKELSEIVASRMIGQQDSIIRAMASILDAVKQNKEVVLQ